MTFCLTLCAIDWSLTKDVVTIVGTLGALTIGVLGLSTWHRQLRGTSEYDVAKKAVLLTYHVRDAMQALRSPLLYLQKEEVDAGRSLQAEQRVYAERMQMVQEKWAELRTLSLEARVIWGEKTEGLFEPVQKLVGELRAEIWLHFWLKGAYAGPSTTVDRSPKRVADNDRIVYWTSDDDEFSQRLGKAVHGIEEFFQAHIRG